MKENNMTALVSCFARMYHYKNNKVKIFSDNIAEKILSREEYKLISSNMIKGITFFNPNFVGTKRESLKWIVDNRLSPSVLGRSIFCEKSLDNAIKLGCKQYLIYASGYDTYAYRNKYKNLNVFEIDKKEMIDDKLKRLKKANIDTTKVNYIESDFSKINFIDNIISSVYNKEEISFNSLLGISYYLTKEEFERVIRAISNIISVNSTIIFDYPTYDDSIEMSINEKLANEAGEKMKSKYSYKDIEKILEENNLLIYEHLDNNEMTSCYFDEYNLFNPNNKINSPLGVSYCLAVKKS